MRNIKQKIQNQINKGEIIIPIVLDNEQIERIVSNIPDTGGLSTKENIESVLIGEIETHTHKLTVINRAQIRRMTR